SNICHRLDSTQLVVNSLQFSSFRFQIEELNLILIQGNLQFRPWNSLRNWDSLSM
ncbi:hypothetical protein GIB67_037965, partial [Kingdonia uniflora]